MDKQIAENDFVEALNLGSTYEGLPIRGLKIQKQKGNTGIFVDAGIHAREWIAPAVATYLINQLIHSNGSIIFTNLRKLKTLNFFLLIQMHQLLTKKKILTGILFQS